MKTTRFIIDVTIAIIIGCAVIWWVFKVSLHVFGQGI
jgi:hypothetical protein